jgi:predicted TIM-barrel fold metal-dependent hydrolase
MFQRSDCSRRRFLRSAGAGLAGGLIFARDAMSANAEPDLLIIDTHAHIYGEDEEAYPTIADPYRPPEGTGTIDHLRREMKANGVTNVTAVQTSTFYRWDNRFTADSARKHRDFMAGICTLDPDDPASSALLDRYVKSYNVRGMRSIVAKSGKLDDPGVDRLWETAERLGIVINALVNREQRPEIEALVARHPRLRVVIDHCLNLKVGPRLQPTLKDMLALAALPNVHAKLSFIPTGSAEEYPCRDMFDVCHAVIEAYGADRCVWGSDFPCELWCPKVTYSQHLKIFTHELGLDEPSKRMILGETARKLWFQERA